MRSWCCERWSRWGEVCLANHEPEAATHESQLQEVALGVFADRRSPSCSSRRSTKACREWRNESVVPKKEQGSGKMKLAAPDQTPQLPGRFSRLWTIVQRWNLLTTIVHTVDYACDKFRGLKQCGEVVVLLRRSRSSQRAATFILPEPWNLWARTVLLKSACPPPVYALPRIEPVSY